MRLQLFGGCHMVAISKQLPACAQEIGLTNFEMQSAITAGPRIRKWLQSGGSFETVGDSAIQFADQYGRGTTVVDLAGIDALVIVGQYLGPRFAMRTLDWSNQRYSPALLHEIAENSLDKLYVGRRVGVNNLLATLVSLNNTPTVYVMPEPLRLPGDAADKALLDHSDFRRFLEIYSEALCRYVRGLGFTLIEQQPANVEMSSYTTKEEFRNKEGDNLHLNVRYWRMEGSRLLHLLS